MSKTLTARYNVVYDTIEEYNADVERLLNYQNGPNGNKISNVVLDEPNKTIQYTHTETV